jgi:hypothetical protein
MTETRQIGPIGTASRVVVGLIAIALPIALSGIGWWDIGAALVAYPIIATAASLVVTAAYSRYVPDAFGRRHLLCSGPACVLGLVIVGIAIGVSALTPVDGVALWVWLGASMLLAAARGYGGCEVLAFPNAITGRRDRIGCLLFTPIDRAEATNRATRVEREGASVIGAPPSRGG